MIKSFFKVTYFILALGLTHSRLVIAFEIEGNKWIGAEAVIYFALDGKSDSGIFWKEALLQAANNWNENTSFTFKPINQYLNPCLVDGLNGVDFVYDLCGTGFGKSTLAVTVRRYKPQVLGPSAIVEADVFINANVSFDIFDSTEQLVGPKYSEVKDFRRVVLHELGHLIGLDHENTEEAIMQPEYGETFSLKKDDIAGVEFLYGGLSSCKITAMQLGTISNSLTTDDCTVKQLTVGGTDESLVDLYSFKLGNPARFRFSVDSAELEAVIIIADSKLNYLASESTIEATCGADLQVNLTPGDYLLLVNTFDRVIREECGVTGLYDLTVGYIGPDVQALGPATSSNDLRSKAIFSGTITADGGLTYGNRYHSTDSLDITASILTDPSHVGEQGFIVAIGLIGREFFWLGPDGKFIRADSVPENLLAFRSGSLNANEEIEIIKNFVPSDYGIQELVVEFYVGYGLDADPDEIYFNTTPMNLTIEKK